MFKDIDDIIMLRSRDLKKCFNCFSTRAMITKIGQNDCEENKLNQQ